MAIALKCFFLFGELGLQANAITFGSVFLEFAFISSLEVFTRNRQDGMAVCEVSLGKHQGVAVHSVWFNTASCNRQTEIGKLSSNEKALRKRRV